MAISAKHRSKFAALHRQWCRLDMSEKFSTGTKNPKQTKTDPEVLINNIVVPVRIVC